MSPIAYLFCEDDEPCDTAGVRHAEDEAAVGAKERLSVMRYSELNVTQLNGMGRRQAPQGSGPCVVQIIQGKRHAFTEHRFTEWIGEYIEYLGSQVPDTSLNRNTHIRSTMGAGKIKVSEVVGRSNEMATDGDPRGSGRDVEAKPPATAKGKVSANSSKRPDVGACSASVQLVEPDSFFKEFAQDGRR